MEIYDLGALIKSLRKQRGMSQQQLADLLHVTDATVSKYEANTATPPFETLRSIASIFNVSMDTLCGMEHKGALSVHGLSEDQIETLKQLTDLYRIRSAGTNHSLTQEQFAVIGKIVVELTK